MEYTKPLAEELLDTVLDLLSFSGFAVPPTSAQCNEKVRMAIWYVDYRSESGKPELGVTIPLELPNPSKSTKSKRSAYSSA
jgi:hypothetical protein